MGFECGFTKIAFRKDGDTPTEALAAMSYLGYLDYLKTNNFTEENSPFEKYSTFSKEDLPDDIEAYRPYVEVNDTPHFWCSMGRMLDEIVKDTFLSWMNEYELYMSMSNLRKLKQAITDKIIANLPKPVVITSAVYYQYDEDTDRENVLLKPLDGVAVSTYSNMGDFTKIINCTDDDYWSTSTYALIDSDIDGEKFNSLPSFLEAVDDIIKRTENGEEFYYFRSW